MSEISDDVTGHGLSVTIKYDKGYDASWIVFRGTVSEIRADIIAAFDLSDEQAADDIPLGLIVLNAQQVAHGYGQIGSKLGGTAIGGKGKSSRGSTRSSGKAAKEDPPWNTDDEAQTATDEPKAEEDPNAWLYAEVEGAESVDALKRLYAENAAAFADEKILAAYKAKGKALQAAAA